MKRAIQIEAAPDTQPIVAYSFDDHSVTVGQLRRWPAEKIHVFLGRAALKPALRTMAEAELRRRDAWSSPAGAAFYLSFAALIVSIAALVVSVLFR